MKRNEKILARLASVLAQEKYIVKANENEYYVPEELLEEALVALEAEENTKLVDKLKKQIKAFEFPEPFDARNLVFNYEPWITIRNLSHEQLNAMGFSLSNWEASDL